MFEAYDDVMYIEMVCVMLCEILKISYNTVYELVRTGDLARFRGGRGS